MTRTWGLILPASFAEGTAGTGLPFPFEIVPRAGAVPTRDEFIAWYQQVSFSSWWQSIEGTVLGLPQGARLALGVMVSAIGVYIVYRSYQRVMRPTQADLVRRVANAAQSNSQSSSGGDVRPEPLAFQSGGARPVEAAPPGNAPRTREPVAFPPSLSPRAFLTADVFTPGDVPWAVPLGHDLIRIGRHQENDVRLEDKTVHRYHALLHRSPDGNFLIRDLSGQAGNGVYVNGARIEQTALRPGDLVELGAVRLRFQQQRPS